MSLFDYSDYLLYLLLRDCISAKPGVEGSSFLFWGRGNFYYGGEGFYKPFIFDFDKSEDA